MPSKSKTQQRLMGQAYAYKTGDLKVKDMNPDYADDIKKLSKSMTKKQLRDFAKTKHKNLPEKVEEKKIMSFVNFNSTNESYIYDDGGIHDSLLYNNGLGSDLECYYNMMGELRVKRSELPEEAKVLIGEINSKIEEISSEMRQKIVKLYEILTGESYDELH